MGAQLKWRPFQATGVLERLSGSLDECHIELWNQVEDFLILMVRARLGGLSWSWSSNTSGPWVDALQSWPDVDALASGIVLLCRELDGKRRQAGESPAPFPHEEAVLLTLSRELASQSFNEALNTWVAGARRTGRTAHPLLRGTVMAWQRAAAEVGELSWSGFLLSVIRGNPEDQGFLFPCRNGAVAAEPCEGPVPAGVARLAPLTGPDVASGEEVERAVGAMVTQAFQRHLPSHQASERFWGALTEIDDQQLLPLAVQTLAQEELATLLRMARRLLPACPPERAELCQRLRRSVAQELIQSQIALLAQSSLSPYQREWLQEGWLAALAAVQQEPAKLVNLLRFLQREEMRLAALPFRNPSWTQAWDWRAGLLAIELAALGGLQVPHDAARERAQPLFVQLCGLWLGPDPAGQAVRQDEAVRRVELMLKVEQLGLRSAAWALRVKALSPLSQTVSTEERDYTRQELCSLKSLLIERVRRAHAPQFLRQACEEALPLIESSRSAWALLFDEENGPMEGAFGGQASLREALQASAFELVPRRVANAWVGLAPTPANEGEIAHAAACVQLVHQIFAGQLPKELSLRVARVLAHPEIARRVSAATDALDPPA